MNRNSLLAVSFLFVISVAFTPFASSATQAGELAAKGNAENGGRLWKRYCVGCHGKDGRGGGHTFMPHIENLTKKSYMEKVPDDFLFLVIDKGGVAAGKNHYMPAWGSKLDDRQIYDLIAHIRELPKF